MLSLSNSASDGIFWNLITGCSVLISDGTFNQKGNQKVIHSWDSLQSQWSHNTTGWKGLLASSPYVAIKSNWLLSSLHPLFRLQTTAQPRTLLSLSVESGCSEEISRSHADTFLPLSIWLRKLSKKHIWLFRSILIPLVMPVDLSFLFFYVYANAYPHNFPKHVHCQIYISEITILCSQVNTWV